MLEKSESGIEDKHKIISFAGIFTDLDGELIGDLTDNLPQRRLEAASQVNN